MAQIHGHNTKPEILVRLLLHRMGYRFRINYKKLPGKPDIVLPKHKKVIFVNGCFWHGHKGCQRAQRPKTNIDFWNKKLDNNIKRDKEIQKMIRKLGWQILIIWQCQIKNEDKLKLKLKTFMNR